MGEGKRDGKAWISYWPLHTREGGADMCVLPVRSCIDCSISLVPHITKEGCKLDLCYQLELVKYMNSLPEAQDRKEDEEDRLFLGLCEKGGWSLLK